MEKIEATIGYREEYENGKIYFYAGTTDNGMVYKDDDAFCSGTGICYISECSFGEDWSVINPIDGYTKEVIMDAIANEFPGLDCDIIQHIAALLYQEADWLSIEAALNELDIDEILKEFYPKDTFVYWIDPDRGKSNGEYKVGEYKSSDVVLIYSGSSEAEVPISEIYRRTNLICLKCSNEVYHEKYKNTQDHYPFVCFECDENFYRIELI